MSLFGKDTPMERPHPGGRAAVFVPAEQGNQAVLDLFSNGSGLVGFANHDGSLTVYFENNRFNDSALHPWQSKVFKAYDRMVNGAPTVNKVTCDAANVEQVGFIEGPEILVRDMAMLGAWLARCNAQDTAPSAPEIHA